MKKHDQKSAYEGLVDRLKTLYNRDEAMRHAIGGEFEAIGTIERELLRFYGLRPDDYLIDVGCGAGRLARQLSAYLRGPYLGTEIVAELLEYGRHLVERPDWRFELVDGLAIPEDDGRADMICFFSVFTHLLHQHSFMYLEEAKRVVKPGGRIVFSFLEFAEPAHWAVFDRTVADDRQRHEHPLNVFIERPAIAAWAQHLGLGIDDIRAGGDRFVPLPQSIRREDGIVLEGFAELGQSTCVLSRPR